MNYNDCDICQHHEDVGTAKEFLKKAVEASLFALMHKTEEAYEKERVARQAFCEFMQSHPAIEITLKEEENKDETS